MSAAEIIELIKKLPPKERAEVDDFVIGDSAARRGERPVRHMSDEKFAKATSQVFEKHQELLRRLAQ